MGDKNIKKICYDAYILRNLGKVKIMKERILKKLQTLKEKLFGKDMEKWELIKIWLIGIAVFIGVVGVIWGVRVIANMQKQEDPTTAPTVTTMVPTEPTEPANPTVPTVPPTEATNPTEPTKPTEPMKPTEPTVPTEPPHVHTWDDATCTTPKTCTECGATEGKALGHTWQNATCTNPKTCAVCGATEGELLAHAWDDGIVLKEATEEIDGEILYTCTVCGETKTEIIPSLGHAHAYTDVVVTNPTCTQKGYTTHTCRCGDSYTDSDKAALGHDWKAATCVSAKTCQTCGATDGVANGHKWTDATCTMPKTCSACGAKDGTALGHNYSKVVTAPTCTAQGYTTYTCTRCEDHYVSDYVNALGHRYADATCTTPKTCTACGHIDGAALGHVWDNGVVIREATEDADGEKLFTCKNCGDTMTQIIPALDHVHSYSAVVTAPTCTEKGYTTHTCRCGDSYTDSEKATLGHDWIEATCVNAKTCERCGTTEGTALGHRWSEATCTDAKTCSVCGTKDGSALGHNYVSEVTKPTCTEQGYTTYTCSRCGDQYRSDIVAALGHDYADATCTEPQICNRCGKSSGNALGHSYGSWKTVSEATCTQKGQEKRNCVRCDHYETRSVNAKGHSYVGNTVKPTCTEQGYTVYTCEVCDNSYKSSYVDALGHDWLEATCWAAKTCDRCGATDGKPAEHIEGMERVENRIEPIGCLEYGSYDVVVYCETCGVELRREQIVTLPKGHNWADATCTEPKICLTCGRTEGDALGHDWLDATCLTLKTCNRCGITEGTLAEHIEGMERVENRIEPIGCLEYGSYDVVVYCETCGVELRREQIVTQPKGHNWADATCTEPKTCLRCGQTDGDTLGHDWLDATCLTLKTCNRCGITEGTLAEHIEGMERVENRIEPIGCLEYGSYDVVVYCETCGVELRREQIVTLPKGHNWADATCAEPKTCLRCSQTEGDALDHDYDSVVTEPTYEAQGYTTYTCKRCGHSYVGNYTDPITALYENGTLVFRTDGVAYLYGDNDEVIATYTGWDTSAYWQDDAPWYNDRKKVIRVVIEDGVSPVSTKYWFYNSYNLQNVTIGNGVTSIGDGAFHDCTSLMSVTIPDSVTSIGDLTFYGCTSLTSVTIPDSVTSIGDYPFAGCSSLTSITVESGNPVYHSSGNCIIETASKTLVVGCKNSTIPTDGSVTSIGSNAFYSCNDLTSITIPNSVTSIGGYAFYDCNSLTSINIPNSVTSIGGGAFAGCVSLTYNEYYDAKYLGNAENPYVVLMKAKNTTITSCVIHENVKVIASSAFNGCTSLTTITIPGGVTSIGGYAFDDCTGLSKITFVGNAPAIANAAFENVTAMAYYPAGNDTWTAAKRPKYDERLTWVAYEGTQTTYESGTLAFKPDGVAYLYGENGEVLATYTGWDTETYKYDNAPWYNDRDKVIRVVIEDGVSPASTDYWFYAYGGSDEYYKKLKNVTIGNGVTSIGYYFCYNCTSLEYITISNSVTSISRFAFIDCTNLETITIPNSVTSIGDSPFLGCDKLTSITVESGNSVYHSSGNCIIETASKTLVVGCKNSTIPADGSVTIIGDEAFYGCENLTNITIPDSVTSIGVGAFNGCTYLRNITIPDSVTSIGWSAFAGCVSLTSIIIPNSVTSIGNYAFYLCTGLTSITIPNSVTSIGDRVFYGCEKLRSITFEGTIGQWNAITKGANWNQDVPATEVVCSNGKVSL